MLPIPIEAALLGPRLKTIPPTPPASRFWQDNAPLTSSAVTVTLQVVRFGVNLGVSMALARLIAPEDFGIFAMACTFTGLLFLFKDAGMEAALISHRTVTDAELAALASLNLLHGLLLALGCAALGPALAHLYGEPKLATALLLPAVGFLFHGLDVQPSAQLLRTQRFRTHALVEAVAMFTGLGVALFCAWRGAGHWALFTTEPVMALMLFTGHAWAARWRPRFSLAWGEARRFLKFGRDISLTRALSHAGRNVDNLILGLAAGPVSLAFYNKAFRLVGLPQESVNAPLSRLAVPILAETRDNPAEFVRAFRHFNLLSMALGLPAVAFLLVSAEDIVAVVYGSQWTSVTPLLRLLGLMGLCNTFLFATGWVYTSLGTVRRQVYWETLNLAVLTGAFLLGVRWGATGIAIAASIAYAGLRLPALVYCFKDTPLRLRDVGGVLWRPLIATAVAASLVLFAHALLPAPASALVAVVRDGLILGAGCVLGWIIIPGWRGFLRHELRRPEPAA